MEERGVGEGELMVDVEVGIVGEEEDEVGNEIDTPPSSANNGRSRRPTRKSTCVCVSVCLSVYVHIDIYMHMCVLYIVSLRVCVRV